MPLNDRLRDGRGQLPHADGHRYGDRGIWRVVLPWPEERGQPVRAARDGGEQPTFAGEP